MTLLPDARFGLFLDAGTLQRFLAELPIPAAEQVRQRLGLLDGDAAVVAFLGTVSGEGGDVRIRDLRAHDGAVNVVVEIRYARADVSATVHYVYPIDARRIARTALPDPPFDVVFRTPEGVVLFRQARVRPPVLPLSMVEREEEAGDTLEVVQEFHRVYEDGVFRGQVIVRVHEPAFTLYWVEEDDGQVVIYGDLPQWLGFSGSDRPACTVTDQDPAAIAQAIPVDIASTLTLRGVALRARSPGVQFAGVLASEEVPESAWLACSRSVRASDAPRTWLGSEVVDLYPVRLEQRQPRTIEVVEVVPAFHDVMVRLRFHPIPDESVPLDLVVVRPLLVAHEQGRVAVGAYLYGGFDREPSQPTYAVSLHTGEDGRFYTWVLDPESQEVTLFVRLGRCTVEESVETLSVWNPPAGVECETVTAVQGFYTHRDYLEAVGVTGTVSLQVQIVSPARWRSEPFTVVLP